MIDAIYNVASSGLSRELSLLEITDIIIEITNMNPVIINKISDIIATTGKNINNKIRCTVTLFFSRRGALSLWKNSYMQRRYVLYGVDSGASSNVKVPMQ